MPLILKYLTRLGIQQGTGNLYGPTPLAACQVRVPVRSLLFAIVKLKCLLTAHMLICGKHTDNDAWGDWPAGAELSCKHISCLIICV